MPRERHIHGVAEREANKMAHRSTRAREQALNLSLVMTASLPFQVSRLSGQGRPKPQAQAGDMGMGGLG